MNMDRAGLYKSSTIYTAQRQHNFGYLAQYLGYELEERAIGVEFPEGTKDIFFSTQLPKAPMQCVHSPMYLGAAVVENRKKSTLLYLIT